MNGINANTFAIKPLLGIGPIKFDMSEQDVEMKIGPSIYADPDRNRKEYPDGFFVDFADNYDESDPELGYSYLFPNLQLSLWRSTIPEDLGDSEGEYSKGYRRN